MKGYFLKEKKPSLYQVKAYSLFYTTQLQEFVYSCNALKLNYDDLLLLYEDIFHVFY